MEYLASNILLKLKNEKAGYTMVNELDTLLSSTTTYNPTTFEAALKVITDKYFKETSQNYPSYIQDILNNISNKSAIEKIIAHQKSCLNEEVKTLEMQLQLLDNTTGAYEIDNKDKEKGFWYKVGAWMDRHPYLTLGGSVLGGAAILATGGLIGGVAGAITSTGLMAAKIGSMTAAKKASHYTKEQKGQEKRLTHGLNAEKQAMDNIRKVMQNAPWYSWRKYKAKRQFKLYQESTQKNVADTTRLVEFINRFVAVPGTLDPSQQSALENYITNGLARLDYYKNQGHNFVASQDRTKVEIDMRNLYTAINQGCQKLGRSLSDMRTNVSYTSLISDLTDDYDRSFRNFKSQRRQLELKYGIGAGVLYAGTAVGLQYILGSGMFGNHEIPGKTIVIEGKEQYVIHDEVKDALTKAGATQENLTNIEKAMQTAQSSSPDAAGYNQQARWTIVKTEMGWTETQVNGWMDTFMKDTLRNLNESGSEFKNQLLDAKINTLTTNSPAAQTADAFLSSPKIGLIQPGEGAEILKNIQDWMGGKDIAAFTATEKIKMGYYGHLFIGNDIGTGSRLMEEVTKLTTVGGKVIDIPGEIVNRHYWLDGIGMPVFANTFMERMKPKKDELGKLIEMDKPDLVPDPTIVITDKDHPASTTGTPTYSWLTGK